MPLIRAIARPMLASTFVIGGVDAFRNPDSKVPAAEEVVGELTNQVPSLKDTRQLVQIDGAVKVIAGSLLAIGKLPRLSSLALAASLIPTTIAGHRFWEKSDAAVKANDRIHFFKNLSMLGGLVIAAVDTGGKPDLTWRTRRAGKALAERVQTATDSVGDALHR